MAEPATVASSERRFDTRAEARAAGRAQRKAAPRTSLAERTPAERDPVAHLQEQNADRVPDLVPLRMARMLADPFSFFRGTAGLMALDMAHDPHSGIVVPSCGDAHISNFGFYASPERRLVFDLNDFDEAAVAPWEWDVKRLVTSIVVGGMHAQYDELAIRRAASSAVATYARSLMALSLASPTDRYFAHVGFAGTRRRQLDARSRAVVDRAVAAAERRTGARAVRRTTERGPDGRLRFLDTPPTMTHVPEARVGGGELFRQYQGTVEVDVALLLAHYAPADAVRRVVGVGSVGTRCYLFLLEGADDDALLLQVKEAGESVLTRYGGIVQPSIVDEAIAQGGQGARVTGFQRTLQGLSDPFLGQMRGGGRDYYVRQFNDMKGSIEVAGLDPVSFAEYGDACATMLARAHSQGLRVHELVGYLGASATAGRAIVEWAFQYAQQSLADYEALRAAAAAGRVPVA
jgi:uncharacterized protein (DUF2252 family)